MFNQLIDLLIIDLSRAKLEVRVRHKDGSTEDLEENQTDAQKVRIINPQGMSLEPYFKWPDLQYLVISGYHGQPGISYRELIMYNPLHLVFLDLEAMGYRQMYECSILADRLLELKKFQIRIPMAHDLAHFRYDFHRMDLRVVFIANFELEVFRSNVNARLLFYKGTNLNIEYYPQIFDFIRIQLFGGMVFKGMGFTDIHAARMIQALIRRQLSIEYIEFLNNGIRSVNFLEYDEIPWTGHLITINIQNEGPVFERIYNGPENCIQQSGNVIKIYKSNAIQNAQNMIQMIIPRDPNWTDASQSEGPGSGYSSESSFGRIKLF